MSLSFASDIFATYFTTDVATDANYQVPGNFGLSETLSGGVGIASIAINTAGTYTTIPAATTTGGAILQTKMSLRSASAIATAGTVYAPADTITLVGGVAETIASLTVATCKLVSATIVAGGTGYGNAQTFTVSVNGGTHSVTATLSVTTNVSGVVTTINSVSAAGSYTVLPTLAANAVTGDDGTDHGSGLTLNLVFGVNTFTVAQAGLYTSLPANPISTTSSGSGTGFTLTGSWQVAAIGIIDPGAYETGVAPTITFGSGSAAATATLAVATETQTDEKKLLMMVEILRSFISEANSVRQLRDTHMVIERMLAAVKTGGGRTTFNASTAAANAVSAGMNYIAKNPKRNNIVL